MKIKTIICFDCFIGQFLNYYLNNKIEISKIFKLQKLEITRILRGQNGISYSESYPKY